MPRTTRCPDIPGQVHVATVHYDFSLDGGAEGEIVLPGTFPTGALFLNAVCNVLEALEGEGASAALMMGEEELVPAAAVASWPEGLKLTEILTAVGAFNPALLIEDLNLSLVITDADLTAGKIAVHVLYVMSPTAPVQLLSLSDPEPPPVEESVAPEPVIEEPVVEDPVVEEESPRRRRRRDPEE